ncbi:class II fructose-bisphosphate aldolase [bacterium]|nr:class II fructose-bisphosphate aldolase [bacterium]
MSHVCLTELLRDAQQRQYAVPNLWGCSMEMLLGQLDAAEEVRAPLSLCYCQGQYPDMPLDLAAGLIVKAAERATVPVMTILDHGTDFESCVRSMQYGFTAVMFDGSSLPLEDNIERTREIVKIGHALGVAVEGELGAVGGSAAEWGKAGEYRSTMTDPDQVARFVAETGIDALAISFGNRHGLYQGAPHLDFHLVARVRSVTDLPLVMHGASDLTDEAYPRIVQSGISKVHFWSGPAKLAVQNLKEKLATASRDGTPPGYQDVFRWNVAFFREITKKYLILLNAAGKA